MPNLIIEPNEPGMTWEQFRRDRPPRSVAIDGYVVGPPSYDPSGPCVNFNHHAGVDRLATRATCAQVAMAMRQGFTEAFGHSFTVWANDCDEDVCLSWFLLDKGYFAEDARNPILNRLIQVEDLLDATGGAYPLSPSLPILAEIAWVFLPYRAFRNNGGLDRRDAREFRQVVDDVGLRIQAHLLGRGDSLSLDAINGNYEVIGRIGLRPRGSVPLVREHGPYARAKMFAEGIRAFIQVREREDGGWTYTIGRASQFVPFDLPRLFAALCEREPGWGGGDLIGGSPRPGGSRIAPTPGELAELVTEYGSIDNV